MHDDPRPRVLRGKAGSSLGATGTGKQEGACLPSEPTRSLTTPDGRYLVVRGRLWRTANPALPADVRKRLVADLMAARRAVATTRRAADAHAEAGAHAAVDAAKHALGERGPVWWTDGAPDLNRHMARTTPYADWYAGLEGKRRP